MNKLKDELLAIIHIAIIFGLIFSLTLTGTSAFKIFNYLTMIFVNSFILNKVLIDFKFPAQNNNITIVLILSTFSIYILLQKQYTQFYILNIIILFILLTIQTFQGKKTFVSSISKVSIFPLIFTLLHWVAIKDFNLNNNAKHIWQSFFVMVNIYLLISYDETKIKKYVFHIATLLVFTYTILQSVAILIEFDSFGTTKNPHHLALYSALLLSINVFLIFQSKILLKIALTLNAIPLTYFILMSSSRPVWIGLVCSTIFFLTIYERSKYRHIVFILIAVQIFLLMTNIQGYRERLFELVTNITTEERVFIWKEAIRLQQTSSMREWLIGHGIDSFRSNFKLFSNYNSATGYHSPHNILLDTLYTFGSLGVLFVTILYTFLYKESLKVLKNNHSLRPFILLLLILITTNFIFNAINMPFLSVFNIFQIAIFAGIVMYLTKKYTYILNDL